MVLEEQAKDEYKKWTMVENIKNNYRQIEKSIVEQLYMKQDLHGTTIGSEREDIWGQLFEMILPKKFVMEHSVFIIDSQANISHEVDLAIIDEMYTPYIFRYGKIKFIPIEAVAAVVECKSQRVKNEPLEKWIDEIEKLQTSDHSIARMATMIAIEAVPTQKSTRPIRILCALQKELENIEAAGEFDFILSAVRDVKGPRIDVQFKDESSNLMDWYEKLNFSKTREKFCFVREEKAKKETQGEKAKKLLEETKLSDYNVQATERKGEKKGALISLLTFNFQLNQLLMLINNPMLFPHRAYVDMFNSINESKE